MGRGIAYQHPFFMLFDQNVFWSPYGDTEDMTPEQYEEHKSQSMSTGDGEWDEEAQSDFREEVAKALGAEVIAKRWTDREAYIFAESDRLEVGIDNGGGGPCVFVQPKTYEVWRKIDGKGGGYVEQEYSIARIVNRGFNKLCRQWKNMWSVPTSAWTSMEIEQYSPLRERKARAVTA